MEERFIGFVDEFVERKSFSFSREERERESEGKWKMKGERKGNEKSVEEG